MAERFKIGDHVWWNSEVGHVSGTIIKVHTADKTDNIAPALPGNDSPDLHGVRPRAIDPVAAGRLWQLSEQLTGASLD